MIVLSLREVNELRVKSSKLCLEIQRFETEHAVLASLSRRDRDAHRERIELALAERIRAPVCPFCGGAVAETSTKGRLGCVDCQAVLLVGR